MQKVWKMVARFGLLLIICSVFHISDALPISDTDVEIYPLNETALDPNGTAKDLYVIKTIVYEVGILTDVNNDTINDTNSHEEVDLTFFDPITNGSVFDLSNIPIPIQTNISGISVTGILPANLGTIELPRGKEGEATFNPNFPLQVPLLPNALISIKRNISTDDEAEGVKLLENLPDFLDLSDVNTGLPLKVETDDETTQKSDSDSNSKQHKTSDKDS